MIHWTITEPQADQILNILAQRPFTEVNNLIQELLRQAQADRVPPQAIAKPNGAAQAEVAQ